MLKFYIDPVLLSLGVCLGVLVIAILIAQFRTAAFDLRDLIMENGRIELTKTCAFVCFILSAWGFIFLITHDKMTEWYFGLFVGAFCGNQLVRVWLSQRIAIAAVTTNPVPLLVK